VCLSPMETPDIIKEKINRRVASSNSPRHKNKKYGMDRADEDSLLSGRIQGDTYVGTYHISSIYLYPLGTR
jgi:hypothetical protein